METEVHNFLHSIVVGQRASQFLRKHLFIFLHLIYYSTVNSYRQTVSCMTLGDRLCCKLDSRAWRANWLKAQNWGRMHTSTHCFRDQMKSKH